MTPLQPTQNPTLSARLLDGILDRGVQAFFWLMERREQADKAA